MTKELSIDIYFIAISAKDMSLKCTTNVNKDCIYPNISKQSLEHFYI